MIGYKGKSSKPRSTYPPHPLIASFDTILLIEMPSTPQGPQVYTVEELEEERTKIWSLHVELGVQYENKLRDSIMYLVDTIGWLAFYEQLSKLMDIWNELKNNEATLKPIVKKWNSRDNDVTILCCSVISLSCEQIEKHLT